MSPLIPPPSRFQGRTKEQNIFFEQIRSTPSPAPIISISGPGGIGKSSLLERFEETAKAHDQLVCKVNLEDCKTPDRILHSLSYRQEKISFKNLKSATDRLNKVWKQVHETIEEEAKNSPALAKDFTGAGVGGGVGLAVGGPVGLLLGAASGAVAGRLTEKVARFGLDWFTARGVSADDAVFALDPIGTITNAFVEDINATSQKKYVILMLDGYERIKGLDGWIRFKLIQGQPALDDKVLVVIASRDPLPTDWGKIKRPLIHLPLTPLSEKEAGAFLDSYGINDAELAAHIKQESKCIPLFLEFLAEAESLRERAPGQGTQHQLQSRGRFVERLLDHLPADLRDLVEAASILRGFDQDILSATVGRTIDRGEYQSVVSLGFMELWGSGRWAIQEEIRAQIEASLRERSADTHQKFHQAAKTYYRGRLSSPSRPLDLPAALEVIYHSFRCGEFIGLNHFQDIFLHLSWPPNFPASEAAIAELSHAISRGDCSEGWDHFFNSQLLYIRNDWEKAKEGFRYVGDNDSLSLLLRGKAYEHLGWIEFHQGHIDRAFKILQRAHTFFQQINDTSGLYEVLNHLGRISRRMGRHDMAMAYHQTVIAHSPNNEQAKIEATRCIARLFRDTGDWAKALELCEQSLYLARQSRDRYDEALALSRLAELYCYQGRFQDAQLSCGTAFSILTGFDNSLALAATHTNAGRAATMLARNDEALTHCIQALWLYRQLSANVGAVLVLLEIARHYMLNGWYKRAEGYCARSGALASLTQDEALKALCMSSKAQLKLIENDYHAAKSLFERSIEVFDSTGYTYRAAEASIGLATATWKTDRRLGKNALKSAEKRILDGHFTDLSIRLSVVLASKEYELGRRKQALTELESSLRKASNFSPTLATSLARETKLLWNIAADSRATNVLSLYSPHTSSQYGSIELSGRFAVNATTGEFRPSVSNGVLSLPPDQVLLLLHHGLTEERIKGQIQGRRDSPLSETSHSDLAQTASHVLNTLRTKGVDLRKVSIYCSPAIRAYETAFAVADRLSGMTNRNPEIIIREQLENIGLGSWEGLPKTGLLEDPIWLRLSSGRDFAVSAPGISSDGKSAETLLRAVERCFSVLSEIISVGESAIVVGHKMSLIIPGILFFSPNLLLDPDGAFNWRTVKFPQGGYIVVSESGVEIAKA